MHSRPHPHRPAKRAIAPITAEGAEFAPQTLPAPRAFTQRLRAIMRTCGLYDLSGEFAYRVGMPAKSGVGGGILAINPARDYAVCTRPPPLDRHGDSIAATETLALLAAETGAVSVWCDRVAKGQLRSQSPRHHGQHIQVSRCIGQDWIPKWWFSMIY